jgi:predicted kinase
MAATIVALLMGLPASGKSTLAARLVTDCEDNDTHVARVEYDEIEDGLLGELNPSQQDGGDSDAHAREVWKESRQKSLELFQAHLADDSSRMTQSKRIILMDDNFHLRSMRREIYRICQEYVKDHDAKIYFSLLWVDTPQELCLERNPNRPRPVPEDVIHRMSTTLQPPGKENFEHCFLRIHNLPTETSAPPYEAIREFVTRRCMENYEPVPPPPPPIDWEQLEEERRKTRESWLHGWDQRLRKWVGLVAQIARKDTGKANQSRKTLLTKLRQEQQGESELPTEGTIAAWFWQEMQVEWTETQIEQFQNAANKEGDG